MKQPQSVITIQGLTCSRRGRKGNKTPSDPRLNYQIKYKFRNHSKPKPLCKIYEAHNSSLYKFLEGGGLCQNLSLKKK